MFNNAMWFWRIIFSLGAPEISIILVLVWSHAVKSDAKNERLPPSSFIFLFSFPSFFFTTAPLPRSLVYVASPRKNGRAKGRHVSACYEGYQIARCLIFACCFRALPYSDFFWGEGAAVCRLVLFFRRPK